MGRRRVSIVSGAEAMKGVRVGGSDKVKRPRRVDSLAASPGEAHENAHEGARHDYNGPTDNNAVRAVSTLFEAADAPQVADADARAARYELMEWVGKHPDTWRRMEAEAARIVRLSEAHGKKVRLSVAYLVEFARIEGIATASGDLFAVNNNLQAAMARYLVELHPEWRGYFELRRSKADGAFELGGE